MKAKTIVFVCSAAVVVTAGCAMRPRDSSEAEQARMRQAEIARARAQAEVRAAVARPGAKVCRELTIGIGVPDVIKGVVVAVEGDRVQVRIEHPGRYPMTLNGDLIRPGMVLQDPASAWTPCL